MHYTTKEAAELLRMQVQTLHKWAMTGQGPVKPVRVGRSLRWPKEDIDRVLRGGK